MTSKRKAPVVDIASRLKKSDSEHHMVQPLKQMGATQFMVYDSGDVYELAHFHFQRFESQGDRLVALASFQVLPSEQPPFKSEPWFIECLVEQDGVIDSVARLRPLHIVFSESEPVQGPPDIRWGGLMRVICRVLEPVVEGEE